MVAESMSRPFVPQLTVAEQHALAERAGPVGAQELRLLAQHVTMSHDFVYGHMWAARLIARAERIEQEHGAERELVVAREQLAAAEQRVARLEHEGGVSDSIVDALAALVAEQRRVERSINVTLVYLTDDAEPFHLDADLTLSLSPDAAEELLTLLDAER